MTGIMIELYKIHPESYTSPSGSSQSDVYNLTNLVGMMTPSERYSNWWDKNENCVSSSDELVMIDHILVSEKIKKQVKNVFMYHHYDMFCDSLDSDHYPIIVDFE